MDIPYEENNNQPLLSDETKNYDIEKSNKKSEIGKQYSKNSRMSRTLLSSNQNFKLSPYDCGFVNRRESEEETQICRIIMLELSLFKIVFIMPILFILTLGFILLFCYWYVSLRYILLFSKTKNLSSASYLYVFSTRNQKEIVKINRNAKEFARKDHKYSDKAPLIGYANNFEKSEENTPLFNFRFTKYYFDKLEQSFVPIEFDYYKTYEAVHDSLANGVKEGEDYHQRVDCFGKCNIVLPEKGIFQLLIQDILNPFYLFQMFSIVVWFFDEYQIYAYCIIATTLISVTVELYELKKNFNNLKRMAFYECDMTVNRIDSDGNFYLKNVKSNDIVPGDIIVVPQSIKMPCDAILLSGTSIVNESMLTGESIPVIKIPLPHNNHETYNPDEDKNYTLYSGTEVIQNKKLAGKDAMALVIRTNYDTLKGSLIKSILFPKPNRFNFYTDSMKFIGVMGILALLGFASSLPILIKHLPIEKLLIRCFNLITIAVPPALPAAMSVGIVFALSRLKEGQIFSISPQTINVAGRVKTIVFDKTGTLTEDSLRFSGVTIASDCVFEPIAENVDILMKPESDDPFEKNQENEVIQNKCLECMVTCHSIAQVHDKFIGDPLDVEMFKSTRWELNEPNHEEQGEFIELTTFNPPSKYCSFNNQSLGKASKRHNDSSLNQSMRAEHEDEFVQNQNIKRSLVYKDKIGTLAVLKRFEFSSALQRMSVITLNHEDKTLTSYVKGSPEMIESLCNEKTVPSDFFDVLERYTKEGLRVLGMAFRILDDYTAEKVKVCKREEIESNLTFIGFLIMENKIKPETNPCIQVLQKAKIATIMATGDNGLTAISVGRHCKIIESKKTAYLAERVLDDTGNPQIEWIKIEVYKELEESSKHPSHRSYIDRRISSLKKTLVHRLSHLSGYEESLPGVDNNNQSYEMSKKLEECPWQTKNDLSELSKYEIAITGKAFQLMIDEINDPYFDAARKEINKKLLLHAKVYARMSPDHKAMLITELQNHTSHMVAMCGDGANDCKALKTADAGLSLSEAEASIAAPFTSKIPNISPMIKLLREGRTSLVTSFQVFKFMALYSMIQFTSVVILYQINSNLAPWEYLFIDLFVVIPLSLTMSRTGAYHKLHKTIPNGKLLSWTVLISVLGQIAIQAVPQIAAYFILRNQSWFAPLDEDGERNYSCIENTTVFYVSLPIYIIVIVVFGVGKPFRKPIWTNIFLCAAIFVTMTMSLLIIFWTPSFILDLFEIKDVNTSQFKGILMAIAGVYCVVAFLFEYIHIQIQKSKG